MSSVIFVWGEINESSVTEIKSSFKSLLANPGDKEIILDIKSEGGNLEALRRIKTFMYFMTKFKGYKIIGRILYAESTALLLALNCEERQVTEESIGKIHLPVLNRKYDPKKLAEERTEQASFIMRRCNMQISWKQVFELEGKRLSYKDLLNLGFANKKVETFTLV